MRTCHEVLEHSPNVYKVRQTYENRASAVSGVWQNFITRWTNVNPTRLGVTAALNKLVTTTTAIFLFYGALTLTDIDRDFWTNSSNTDSFEKHHWMYTRKFLSQHITEYTRQRGNYRPSTLDLVFANEENMIQDLQICAPLGSSDYSISKFDFVCPSRQPQNKISVQYHKGDYIKMRDQLGINWEDIEKQWDFFRNKFCEANARCVPRKIVKMNENYSKIFSIPLSKKILRKLKKKHTIRSKMRKKGL